MSILAKDHSDPGTYLESVGERILGEVLNRLPKVGTRPYLDHLLRDYPERGGKRFRPALILLCCEMMGGDPEDAVVSATALELFHNFAIIHDDIEDSSEMRRGSQTLHRIHGILSAHQDRLIGLHLLMPLTSGKNRSTAPSNGLHVIPI